MKFYLAARYSRSNEMTKYRDDLVALGHSVTSRWIGGAHKNFTSEDAAVEDKADVLAADCLIAFNEATHNAGNFRGGRHVEFGIAIGSGKGLIIIGEQENVFHHLPQVTIFAAWEDFCNHLREREDWFRSRV